MRVYLGRIQWFDLLRVHKDELIHCRMEIADI